MHRHLWGYIFIDVSFIAGQSVANYQEQTKHFDMDVDESLFLAAANEVPPDE
jgi:hypothetical protein